MAQGAPRYWQIGKDLKGTQESICSQNWSATLSNLGTISMGFRDSLFLSRQADFKTITVKVNGVSIQPSNDPDGWLYDASSNAITFRRGAFPPNAIIQVTYKAICRP